MKNKLALATIALATSANTAIAQDYTIPAETTVMPQPADVTVTPQPAFTVAPQPAVSAQQYLSAIADKFGVTIDRLQSMLAKLPPQGEGLSGLEISAIASKLNLDKSGKDLLKAKVGRGGTGLTSTDIAMMGAALGLDSPQIAALSTQLGLPNPFASATPSGTIIPTTVNYTVPARTTPGAVEVYPPGMQIVPSVPVTTPEVIISP